MVFYFLSCITNFGASLLIAGYFIWRKSTYKYFILFNLALAFWSFFCILWLLSTNAIEAENYTKLLYLGAAIIPFTFYKFISEITQEVATKRRKILSHLNLGTGVIFCGFILWTKLVIKEVSPILDYPYWPKGGWLLLLFLAYFFANVVVAYVKLWKFYKKTNNKNYFHIFWITLLVFSGGSSNYLLCLDIPFPPHGNILVTGYVALMAYTITRHKLFNMQVVINQAGAFVLTTAFFATGYLFFLIPYRMYVRS